MTSSDGRPPARLDRATAFAIDLGWGALAVLAATLLAFGWLFVRTDLGATHVTDGDSIIAAAVIGAAIPAWIGWVALHALTTGATRGQQRTGLRVEVTSARPLARALRLALHPISVPGWLWLAAVVAILEVPWLPLLVVLIGATIALMGVISIALLITDPSAAPLHDRAAGTRVMRTPGPGR